MKKLLLSACMLLAINLIVLAETAKIIFEENKNQWPSQVKFQADIPGGKLFLEQNTFTYYYRENIDLHRADPSKELKVKSHCYKVHFENSNASPVISGNNRYSWHRNYYLGNDPDKWADNVPLYSQVYYKDVYNNIDMQVYNVENSLKYDLIIHPGGKVNDIKLNYEGTDDMRIENGHLFIKTSVYNLIEQKPYAYQVLNGIKKQVACSYVLEKNNLSFAIGTFNPELPVIIDPTLIASTYSGSTADNWGFTSTYDAAGNIYMAGTASGTGYPTTVGAHDQTYNGGIYSSGSPSSWPQDISITEFNSTGTAILFSTYYGGLGNEQPSSLIVNSNNDLYVLGRTNSTNFPTVGAYQAALSGGFDIILGKFNSTGALLASTYLGGTSDDCVNYNINWDTYGLTKFSFMDDLRSEILLDQSSNVYVASCTKSSNFPITGSVYQSTLNGAQDAVVFKMNSTLSSLDWSTYLGGTNTDAGYSLKLDNSNNVYITGGTSSNDFPTTSGVLNQTYQGGIADGFITVLSNGGTSLLRSTYIGTSSYDQSFFIDIDLSGDLYIFGQSQGTYPVSLGTYSIPGSGQFIHKISGNLTSTIYSTVIGTGSNAVNISPTAFEIDSCGSIYLAGWGRNSLLSSFMPSPSTTTGLPITANAFQSNTDGRDFYIAVLTPDATGLLYGTFFGEVGGADADHLDGGTCRFDKNGILYHAACASCGGTQGFPTTPSCYSSTNNSNHINYPLPTSPPTAVANCNEAVFKMDLGPHANAGTAHVMGSGNCVPAIFNFYNTGGSCYTTVWDMGDGSTFYTPAPTYTYYTPGTYTVTFYCIDSIGTCGYIDTSLIAITVGGSPSLTLTPTDASSCSNADGKIIVNAIGGMPPLMYSWNNGQSTSAATGLTAGIYTVTVVDAVGCTSIDKDTVNCPTGINEWSQQGISILPNPTTGLLAISSTETIAGVIARNLLGQQVEDESKIISPKSRILNLQAAPDGVYFIELQTNRGTVTKKIIKQ